MMKIMMMVMVYCGVDGGNAALISFDNVGDWIMLIERSCEMKRSL